eukprot:CAMPEP_0195030980 /NCGR_PEP_ID=MMETSP0326_2-20130528/60178_1 /TAXON_ID=2866 ORGANISM="Crypthecodinium cohnii, Strain Seligo" /NCGR_SAMPLE_ID=MMETSP0326_2 /ASSEMBLY_ACC=CAM_ASM_000348 /LENGTH=102 /DNA_ID=CAMNT_0040054489 /DNA_START=348 /DNA_END=653 /DNA_ORIENTATION=-
MVLWPNRLPKVSATGPEKGGRSSCNKALAVGNVVSARASGCAPSPYFAPTISRRSPTIVFGEGWFHLAALLGFPADSVSMPQGVGPGFNHDFKWRSRQEPRW